MANERTITVLITTLCMLLVSLSSGTAISSPAVLGRTPTETGATKVLAAVVSNDGVLTDLATGEPVILPPLDESIPVPNGEVFWHVNRDWLDDLGFRHIHYQQRFLYSGPLSDLLSEPYSTEGLPLSGGSLRLHYDTEGVLSFVSGAFFDHPYTPSTLGIRNPSAAVSRAWEALEGAGFEMSDLGTLDSATLDQLQGLTSPRLVSQGNGRIFSLVWEAPTILANGNSLRAALNGGTLDLIHFWDPNPHYLCDPPDNDGATAKAKPQNPNISIRNNHVAAIIPGIGSNQKHESVWPKSEGAEVKIIGMTGTGTDSCPVETGNQFYEVMELQKLGGIPYYGWEWNGYQWVAGKLSAVGDAMWKTKLTMDVFEDLGVNWIDDQQSPARVVAESNCLPGNEGSAQFIVNPTTYAPVGSVKICPLSVAHGQDFSSASSLDVVAHEWGHGLQYHLNLERSSEFEREIHEGWSDVIAHAVEWRKENTGSGFETADWDLDEDSGRTQWLRPVNDDDGDYDTGGGGLSFHKDDACDGWPQHCGLPLAVAFWLVADGETDNGSEHLNPVCQRSDPDDRPYADCLVQDKVTPLGAWNATKVFFRVLTVYASQVTEWGDFAEFAKRSAMEIFGSFPTCDQADDEQDTMQDAFTAIGYPGPTPAYRHCVGGQNQCCTS